MFLPVGGTKRAGAWRKTSRLAGGTSYWVFSDEFFLNEGIAKTCTASYESIAIDPRIRYRSPRMPVTGSP